MIRKINNKKGLSEVVSYVLLIVIAVSLSILVFAWLKVKVPKEKLECPDSVSLILKEYVCNTALDKVEITFQNKGLFKIDGVYIRYSKNINNAPSETLVPIGARNPVTQSNAQKGFLYFGKINPVKLGINGEYVQEFQYSGSLRKVQFEPFINDEKGNQIICEKRVITQEISCD